MFRVATVRTISVTFWIGVQLWSEAEWPSGDVYGGPQIDVLPSRFGRFFALFVGRVVHWSGVGGRSAEKVTFPRLARAPQSVE